MKNFKILIFSLSLFLVAGCSISNMQNKGKVATTNFDFETGFTTHHSIIIIPAKLDGVERNFIFDSGAELTVIQRETIIGKPMVVSGASNREAKVGTELVKSLKIGDVEFVNTFAVNMDLDAINEDVTNFGGLIGQSIAKKANWLIDYPNKKIRLSDKNLADDTFETLNINLINGRAYTYITVDGFEQRVLIDFGSASEINLPTDLYFAEKIMGKYKFVDNKRSRFTIGGAQEITEQIGVIPSVKLGSMEFKNVKANVNVSSEARIGISFFKDHKIYIDNDNGTIKVKR